MSNRLLGSTSGGPALQRIAKRGRRSRVIRCYRALDRLAAAEGVARSATMVRISSATRPASAPREPSTIAVVFGPVVGVAAPVAFDDALVVPGLIDGFGRGKRLSGGFEVLRREQRLQRLRDSDYALGA